MHCWMPVRGTGTTKKCVGRSAAFAWSKRATEYSSLAMMALMQALQVFAYMLNTGVLPDTNTYNALVNACVRDGEVDCSMSTGAECVFPSKFAR